jgi:hypothetical protein
VLYARFVCVHFTHECLTFVQPSERYLRVFKKFMLQACCLPQKHNDVCPLFVILQVSLVNSFCADHDLSLQVAYVEAVTPHVIIEKGDPQKGLSHWLQLHK